MHNCGIVNIMKLYKFNRKALKIKFKNYNYRQLKRMKKLNKKN